eukprot:COSAG01_NODE_17479_length_1148_cov_1.244042_3_plen_77_part_01
MLNYPVRRLFHYCRLPVELLTGRIEWTQFGYPMELDTLENDLIAYPITGACLSICRLSNHCLSNHKYINLLHIHSSA